MGKSITGAQLRKMMISGANYLDENKEYVDSLNVFPVPDGDTGTNMTMTMKSVVRELNLCTNNDMEAIADAVSKGALKGARGNSGVILSQILKGFMASVAQLKTIDVKAMAKAFKEGADIAYRAVTVPKEGTILTVIRCMAEEAQRVAKKETDCAEFLKHVLETGEETLKMTPELLPILKKAGVVDSGGRGLLFVVGGWLKILVGDESQVIFELEGDKIDNNNHESFEDVKVNYNDLADIEFAYCTEFFIININKKTTEADIDKLREKLMSIGNSVICIGDLSLIKVHVHTNEPGVALTSALKLGELGPVKVENMLEQNRALKVKMEPEQLKNIGVVAICAGDGLAQLFRDCNVDAVIEGGQTMNSSAEDIAKACDSVAAENVFVLPNNKNIVMAAQLANDLSKRNIIVIPTSSVPQGINAAIAIDPEASVEDNKENVMAMLDTVSTGSVTYAVRNTTIDGFKLKEGDIMGLDEKRIVAKGSDVNAVATDTIEKMMKDSATTITLFYGQDVQAAEAELLGEQLGQKFPDLEVDVHYGGQPLYYYLISVE